MAAIDMAEARDRREELIDRVAGGEALQITRTGQTVALLSPSGAAAPQHRDDGRKAPIDVEALKAIRDFMPPQSEDAGPFVQKNAR